MHPTIDFSTLVIRSGSIEGARALFETLVTSLIRIMYKDARSIRPNPGDWGIDIIEGSLTDVCAIWQVKYFTNGIGESQKNQIRDSFNQLMKKSKEKSFTVDAWTLCIPCNLSPDETQWWERWSKRMEREHPVKIQLWDESFLRSQLETPDAEQIRWGYFGQNPTILNYFIQALNEKDKERDIQELPNPSLFEEALFIRKLKQSGVAEYYSAKIQFFNAELLTQEILDKGVSEEERDLINIREKLRAMWEIKYNYACSLGDTEIPKIYPILMTAILDHDKTTLLTPVIKASFVHKQGIVHQLADNCHVGWTRDFRRQFQDSYV